MPSQVYESLVGLIVSELCPRCRGRTRTGFCEACRLDFKPNAPSCRVCGQKLTAPGATDCVEHDAGWCTDAVRAPYVYGDPLDRYIYALKFAGERKIGRAFGQLLAAAVSAERPRINALVAVPLHRSRLLERGYNQALEIARSLACELRLPILRGGIVRRHATPPQTRLRARLRQENLRFAFEANRDLRNYRIAIVDDVITTGATVNSLALTLRAAGASYVEAWAVARTQRPMTGASGGSREHEIEQ